MIILEVNNSESKITGLTISDHNNLRALLSYYTAPPNSYVAKQFGVKKVSLLSKQGVFPTGLLTIVIDDFLVPNKMEFEYKDTRVKPTSTIKLPYTPGVTPYKEQVAAVEACLAQGRGVVSACTGFGKSVMMGLLISKLKLRTLVIVPTLELKRQLTESLSQWFPDMSNITVENIASTKLNKATDYDCLIIDEAHHVAASTYRKLNKTAWKGIYHRFFYTATPYRSLKEEQLLFESIAGAVIYEVSHKTAVDHGYIVPIEAYYLDVPKTKPKGHTWAQVYNELVVHNTGRNDLITRLIGILKAQGLSTLCLVKEIAHGDILGQGANVHFANGQDENSEDMIKFFSQGKIKCLVGTTGVLGEGVDTKPAEYIIISGLGKSKNAFIQMCGRGFRNWPGKTSCKIIIFRDNSHRWTLDHFKHQVKYLREDLGVEVERIEI